MTAPNIPALDALIAAVEAGEYRRPNSPILRYGRLQNDLKRCTNGIAVNDALSELQKSDAACAAFLKAYRAQVAG